jgi:chromosome segregation protein
VFLKSLTLKGFKSFADATTMQLEPGVTVVVGPNGSGKSNVVDAIAWVLGAQAPSSVRSQKMDDVIFAGTAKRPALGRAEVVLTLDNSSGVLPIEFTEVTISRTLFRTGESEYAINGVTCRLLDVQELLSDAGVGRQQHVIVSQGQIDAVLNARPEDRRSVIEEAAGVLKYRRRKEKSERRLDATEANLLRVQDLLREVRRQLRPLERQADAARRHGDLVAELSALQLFLAGREIAGLRTRLTSLAGDKLELDDTDKRLRAELAALDTDVLAAEAELTARGDSDIGDEMVRVEQLRERSRGIAAVLVERRRSLERDRGQLMDGGVVANLEADAARLRDEVDLVAAELTAIGPEADELTAQEEAFAAERRTVLSTLNEVTSGATTASAAAAEVRGEMRSIQNGVDRAEGELRRLETRRDALRDRAERLEHEIVRLKQLCEDANESEAPLVADVEAAEARRIAAEAGADVAGAARQHAADELARWRTRA